MLIVTIAALVMAASLGWFAYRLLQQEQRRSEARITLLASALDAAPSAPSPWPVEVPSLAPRVPRPVPPRSDGPRADAIEAPAAERAGVPQVVMLDEDSRDIRRFASEIPVGRSPIDTPDPAVRSDQAGLTAAPSRRLTEPFDTPLHRASASSRAADDVADAEVRGAGLFADVPATRRGDGLGVLAVAALLLVGILTAGFLWFGREDSRPTAAPEASNSTSAPAEPTAARGGVPLDLLSLAHERRGDRLVVRGVVRNPVAGSIRPGLVASVLLLDQSGGFLRGGRAALPTDALAPGADAAFAVELPATSDVRRYRVTFRGADGALVPHADKRP